MSLFSNAQIIPMDCDVHILSANAMNIVCNDVPFSIQSTVNTETDLVSISIDGNILASTVVNEQTDAGSATITWNQSEYEFLQNLDLGEHNIVIITEDSQTGSACYSEYLFSYEECESANDSIIDTNLVPFSISLKVYLQALYNFEQKQMNITANEAGILPKSQPYNSNIYNYSGTEIVPNFDQQAVDWVLVSLRTETGEIIDKKAVLIHSNGQLKMPNGATSITFDKPQAQGSSFWISVDHRSHLGILSKLAYPSDSFIDFTQSDISMGTHQTVSFNNDEYMIAGDLDGNGVINNIDYNVWASDNAAVGQYVSQDIDGNGVVNNIDYNFWEINRQKVGELKLLENGY